MYYRSDEDSVCADVIPFAENGEYYLFYLKNYRNAEKGEGCPWCLLTTKDLVHYEDHGIVLPRGSVEEQDIYVFTGSCTKMGDEYIIYYTGHNPHKRAKGEPEQKILRAKSKDLYHWEKDKDFCFEAPDFMEIHDFRDPFLFYDEKKKKWGMLLAGRVKKPLPIHYGGATFIAYSENGMDGWQVSEKPFYYPEAFYTHECPDLFKMGDYWYLLFSEFTDKIVTRYVMTKDLEGDWTAPLNDTLDGHALYAAKSVQNGDRRILFGWNPIKSGEVDNGPWEWGGRIIPDEIRQNPDGTLYIDCPKEIAGQYTESQPLKTCYLQGEVQQEGNNFTVGKNALMSMILFEDMPVNGKITMTVKSFDIIGDFGIVLKDSPTHNEFYKIKFERKFNRVALDRLPRKDNNEHINVETERYCPMENGREYEVTVIMEGSILEVYVNGVCMGARMFRRDGTNWGIYSHNTKTEFGKVKCFLPVVR